MTDKNFKAGLLVGAAGAVILAVVLSGTDSSADSDKKRSHDNDWVIEYDGEGNTSRKSVNPNRYDDDDKSGDNWDGETRTVKGLDAFNSILIKGGMELNIEVGPGFSVEVTGDDYRASDVEFIVDDGELTIDMPDRGRRFWDDADIAVSITMPEMVGIRVDGAVDAEIDGIDSDVFELDLRGAGDIELSGTCGDLTVDVRGAGDIDAEDLKCKDVKVELRGAGDVTVFAKESIDARLAGIGNIDVMGKPENVRKRLGGLGNISID